MCGIAGLVSARPIERLPALIEGFSRALQHRGPDDCGFLTWGGGDFSLSRDPSRVAPGQLAFIHRRLSIVDLSERGWQPMVDPTGQYAIVFNGEIYNYLELRAELERGGVEFRSQTDTEVLLNLMIRSGSHGLPRAIGMFAFAFLDISRRRVVLARDPFGIKPLFFATRDGAVAFASEIRPLLDLGFAPRVVEPSALFAYLRHAVTDHGELTPVQGVRQLLAAHTLTIEIDSGALTPPCRYWTPALIPGRRATLPSAIEELRALFTDSVRLHLRADVPVAATLSGGVDSSAIVGTIRQLQDVRSLAVFSYIADDPVLGEERYVDTVAGAAGVRPRKIHLHSEQLATDLDSLILTQEQPFTTTSIWAQSRVFRRVHEDGFKVVMDGQGADELFGGYPVFRAARMSGLIRRGCWPQLLRLLQSMPDGRSQALLQAVGSLLPLAVQEQARHLVRRPMMPTWLNGSWFARHRAVSPRPFVDGGATTDLGAQLYDATVATSLPMLLRYADRNAMAVSLENRVPFLTTALAEFALSLPDDLLIGNDGTTKMLLRSAMRGVVPDPILDRRDKIGFATPEGRWFTENAALRGALRLAVTRPLPDCFAAGLELQLQAVAEGQAPYRAEVWRAWNALRWAELLRLEFPS
jgi:asparagine synthase (glutamine-hydrolysing)